MPVAGFLAVDKPGGVTSHDVVARVRRVTGIAKAGHAGTLDPMATGLVVVALGRATRLIRYLQESPKWYEATALFGVATTTLDADGEELERIPMNVSRAEVEAVLPRFTGEIMQIPPMVSALKHGGRRLYELAREGIDVERPARPARIHRLSVHEVGDGPFPRVRFEVVCGKGTYVRTLADDIAADLGGRAHLTALRRTRTGPLSVERHGVTLEGLDGWADRLVEPGAALADLPVVEVDAETARAVRHGQAVAFDAPATDPDGPFRVVAGGDLVAVFRNGANGPRSEVVLT